MKKGYLGAICRFGVSVLTFPIPNIVRLVNDVKSEKAKDEALNESIKENETGE